MRRNTYVRLFTYPRPPKKVHGPLARIVKAGKAVAMTEGRLLDDIRVNRGIQLQAAYRNGCEATGAITSTPVTRIEPGYVLTEDFIYQLVRVPPIRSSPKKASTVDVTSTLEKLGIARQGPRFLTTSQTSALRELLGMAELCGDTSSYGGVQIRNRPLISGLSGSGKTALIGHLCDRLAAINAVPCPFLRVPAGSWILYGARHDPQTFDVIRDFLRKHVKSSAEGTRTPPQGARAIILIDEVDKITSRQGMTSSWYRSVVSEIISVADGDSRLEANGWTKTDVEALKNVLIIGAGAFLDGLEESAEQDKRSHLQAIADHCIIPDEVRLRFNSRILYIEPPTAWDYRCAFRRLYADLGLPSPENLDNLVANAEQGRGGMRQVEEHLAHLLIAHPHLRRSWSLSPEQPKHTVGTSPEADKQSGLTIIPPGRFSQLADDLNQQMQALEAPLAHVQALFRLHHEQFVNVLGDVIDPATHEAISPTNLHTDFTSLLEGLRYNYTTNDSDRNKCNTGLWLAGHRVLAAVWGAIIQKQEFLLEECYLALFTQVYAQLGRILRAVKHISTVRSEGSSE